jgi:hypothetical protein
MAQKKKVVKKQIQKQKQKQSQSVKVILNQPVKRVYSKSKTTRPQQPIILPSSQLTPSFNFSDLYRAQSFINPVVSEPRSRINFATQTEPNIGFSIETQTEPVVGVSTETQTPIYIKRRSIGETQTEPQIEPQPTIPFQPIQEPVVLPTIETTPLEVGRIESVAKKVSPLGLSNNTIKKLTKTQYDDLERIYLSRNVPEQHPSYNTISELPKSSLIDYANSRTGLPKEKLQKIGKKDIIQILNIRGV